MIEIDFESFHNQDYIEEGYDLYVVKNGLGDVLYVGETWIGIRNKQSSLEKVTNKP